MKAITVQQPWAWAIVHGGKSIENRTRIGTWKPADGERIAIHAGKRWSERGEKNLLVEAAFVEHEFDAEVYGDPPPLALILGVILGTVEVIDVHPDAGCCQPWGEQSYVDADGTKRVDVVHLVLENPIAVDPIPCTGKLGLWTVPDDIAAAIA